MRPREKPGSAVERRGPDRRQRSSLRSHWTFAFRGRRRRLRRASDRVGSGAVVDWFGPHLLVMAITVCVLSGCDAAFTLTLMDHGVVEEANPLMRFLINHDIELFVSTKMLVTGLGVIGLVAYSQMLFLGWLPLTQVLVAIALFYVALVGYELTLLSLI